jgi:hypothetical protein
VLKIYRKQKSNRVHAYIKSVRVPIAATHRIGTKSSDENCMISETCPPTVPSTFGSAIHSTVVQNATDISMPTSPILLTPAVTIPVGLFIWPCVWLWRTACHTARLPGTYGETTEYSFPGLQFKTGLKRREKKSEQRITTEYLDGVLADFSGYIAADELYDGPFCVLSIVDNHNFRRLIYDVLDHNPTHEDMTNFFGRFRMELDQRSLTLSGATTDGSPLYPEPLAQIFPEADHQVCEFHVLKEINREILKAVTKVRRELKSKLPKLKRGRPSSQSAKKAASSKKKQEKKIADLFEHRYLFVQHSLSLKDKKKFLCITRGLSNLRNLRSIMDQVYRLFDRRCRTETALEKLAVLRRRIGRFKTLRQTLKKLFTPNIEKALTFLDDSQLPSTSNAVERGYRRHRKMQKSVYRVRTQNHISQRVAIDMQRDEQSQGRLQTITTLHDERAGMLCCR